MTREPHTDITCGSRDIYLNLVAVEGSGSRTAIVDFVREDPDKTHKTWKDMKNLL